mgnify:CR=1 FL=1
MLSNLDTESTNEQTADQLAERKQATNKRPLDETHTVAGHYRTQWDPTIRGERIKDQSSKTLTDLIATLNKTSKRVCLAEQNVFKVSNKIQQPNSIGQATESSFAKIFSVYTPVMQLFNQKDNLKIRREVYKKTKSFEMYKNNQDIFA